MKAEEYLTDVNYGGIYRIGTIEPPNPQAEIGKNNNEPYAKFEKVGQKCDQVQQSADRKNNDNNQ